jgi:deoxyribose-phosphate aldolase
MSFDRTIARLIDHTILKPEATRAEVRRVCAEALQYEFASVCVNPFWAPVAAAELRGSPVPVCTVVGFPLGATSTEAKAFEAERAIGAGAREVDMVIHLGALLGGEPDLVLADIQKVVAVSHGMGAIVKVIVETGLLDESSKILACRLSARAGADFVKTSTGFSRCGAPTGDVALMRRTVGASVGVKASGSIRTLDDLKAMVAAGATRIGTSSSVSIMEATGSAATVSEATVT